MGWYQCELVISPQPRGLREITSLVMDALPSLRNYSMGFVHLFLQHTSASLTINENADPDVPRDLESVWNAIAPESFPYLHTLEGPDDMPAHVKSSLMGCSLTIPVREGKLALGTWQGIYLAEHRNSATARHVIITLHGEFSPTAEISGRAGS